MTKSTFNPQQVLEQMSQWKGKPDVEWNRGAAGEPIFHASMDTHVAQIEYEMGLLLMDLVRTYKPETLVEVGTNRGYSTSCLLVAMEQNQKGHLTTFDIEDVRSAWWGPQCWEILKIPETRLTVVKNSLWDASPQQQLPEKIDFVFHDASHEVDQTEKEIETLAPRMTSSGVISFHDIFLCRHMGEFLLSWFNQRKTEWKYEEIQKGRGLGIACKLGA